MNGPVDPSDRIAVRRAIAAHLVDAGWRFRRGSTAPWIPPDEPVDTAAGYSLLGAAGYQAELERRRTVGERHAA